MIIVHGRASSSNVQIVMWAIAELGLEHRRLDVGHAFGGNDTPEFLAMNPNGLVPVIQDGDVTLFESAAILRYLGGLYGDENFWPTDPGRRARLDQWAEWTKTTFVPAITPLFRQLVRTREADRDQKVIASSAAEMKRLAQMADARIGDGPFLDGSILTFADIVFGHQLYRYFTMPFERADLPNLRAHYDRLSERPAFAKNVMVSYEALRAR